MSIGSFSLSTTVKVLTSKLLSTLKQLPPLIFLNIQLSRVPALNLILTLPYLLSTSYFVAVRLVQHLCLTILNLLSSSPATPVFCSKYFILSLLRQTFQIRFQSLPNQFLLALALTFTYTLPHLPFIYGFFAVHLSQLLCLSFSIHISSFRGTSVFYLHLCVLSLLCQPSHIRFCSLSRNNCFHLLLLLLSARRHICHQLDLIEILNSNIMLGFRLKALVKLHEVVLINIAQF